MTSFHPAVDPLLDPTVDPTRWVERAAIALESGMFENTWRIDAGSSRRVVFGFADDTVLSWLGGEGDAPVWVQVWQRDGSQGAAPGPEWDWNADFGVWEASLDEPLVLVQVVESLIAVHGPVTSLVFPWEPFASDEFVDEIVYCFKDGDSFEQKLAAADPDALVDAVETLVGEFEGDEAMVTSSLALAAAVAGGVRLPLAWGSAVAEVTDGAHLMPPNSPNARFMAFIRSIEELGDWIVVWDECCAACFGGTYKMMLADKGLPEGTPSVALFAQNSQYAFPPDGSVSYELFQGDAAQCELLAQKAAAVGLPARVTPGGSVILG